MVLMDRATVHGFYRAMH